jgi:primary-amine oxidase
MKINRVGDWIDVAQKGEDLPLDEKAPPQEVLVGGQRFKVDDEEKYVEWMDFTFFITYVAVLDWVRSVGG